MFAGLTFGNRKIRVISLIGLMLLVTGCEAKLDLSAVTESKTKPQARYDQYQAAAKSDKAMVVIGNRGVMLISNDLGESWGRQVLPGNTAVSYPTLVDIDVCPDGRFVALDADRKIWFSDLNAQNWTSKAIPTEEDVLDLTCDQNGTLWVVGSFTLIMESRDGGESWTDKSIAEDAMFSRIQFIDRDQGIVTGEFGTVYQTGDGGKSWEMGGAIPHEFYPMASYFASADEGWVGGLQGIIFHTTDGGRNWLRQETGTKAPIYNICVVNGKTYAVGEQGTILVLTGNAWKPVDAKLGFGYLRALLPMADGKLLVAGGGGLVRMLNPQDLKN